MSGDSTVFAAFSSSDRRASAPVRTSALSCGWPILPLRAHMNFTKRARLKAHRTYLLFMFSVYFDFAAYFLGRSGSEAVCL